MAEQLNQDLNIIQRSAIEIQVDPITSDLNIIQQLDDEPNDVGGLTAAELKAKFDEAGNIIKNYINDSLIPQVLGAEATEAAREANEAQRQAAETSRKTAESIRIETEHERNRAELDRRREELNRQTAETQRQAAETQRQAAEGARETAFTQGEAARTEAFQNAQDQRDTAFQEAQTARETAFAGSQESRETAFIQDETAWMTAFQNAQNQRNSAFKEAQTARETAFTVSQQSRETAFTASQQSREERFEAAEEARNSWGDYDGTRSYVPGNKVYYLGSSYVNTAACRGVAPGNAAYWQIIARKGADGKGSLTPEEADLRYLQLSGGTMTGAINLTAEGVSKTGRISLVSAGGTGYSDQYVNISGAKLLPLSGLELFSNRIEHVGNPTAPGDAANKRYVDTALAPVKATEAATEEVTLSASGLPAYIAGLPRMLTKHYIIHISGSLSEPLEIRDFYGGGGLSIVTDTLQGSSFLKPVSVYDCGVGISLKNMKFSIAEELEAGEAMLSVYRSIYVNVSCVEFAGGSQVSPRAIQSCEGSRLMLDACSIHNAAPAVYVSSGANVSVRGGDSAAFHNNGIGVYADCGGTAFLYAPDLMGGVKNMKRGGLIVKSDGTLL